MEANATSSKVFIDRMFKSADCKGSKWAIWSARSTRAKSQEGMEGVEEDLTVSPPLRNLTTRSYLPTYLPSMWSWYEAIAAAWTLRVEGDCLCSNSCCKKESTTLIEHIRGSSRWEEHHSTNKFHFKPWTSLVEGACAEAMVLSTSGGKSPRTSASGSGTRHGVSRGLDMGAKGCPVSEKEGPSSEGFAREELSRGAWVPVGLIGRN